LSTLTTLSSFYFGHTVTLANKSFPFKEGAGPEIKGELRVGSYSLTEFAAEIQRMLNTFGLLTYTVTVNRTTGIITINATGSFTVLAGTGTTIGSGVFSLAGFNAVDKTGTSVVGDNRSGYVYRPQYLLKNYTSPEHMKLKEQAAVNISATGKVQVISFGDGQRMKCNIVVITDKLGLKLEPFYENANGLADAIFFMDYLITKAKVEFMPDYATPSIFYKMLLDSNRSNSNGVGYELENMGTPDVYQTGDMTFRKVV
jgi:hypothetical protein